MESGEAAAVANDDALLFGLVGKAKDPTAFDLLASMCLSSRTASCITRNDPAFEKKLIDSAINKLFSNARSNRFMPSGSRARPSNSHEPVHERKPQAACQISTASSSVRGRRRGAESDNGLAADC